MATGFTKNFVVKNGITTGNITLDANSGNITGTNLSVTGLSELGNIGNVKITGGTSGQAIVTDGTGNLSFANASAASSPAPMPTYVAVGDDLLISANYQGLFGYPITIDGTMTVDGVLIDVNDNGNGGGGGGTATALNANIANVSISGGTSGYYLQTDGSGVLSWAAGGGGGSGSPGGVNTQVQFNDAGTFGGNAGFTFNKTTGIFTAPYLAGNGNGLSNIQGANVSGAVGLATYATTANSVAGANVSGTVSSATTAGTVTTAAQPNITSIGTQTTLSATANITGGNIVTAGTGNLGTLYVGSGGANINGYTKITGNIDVTGNFNVTGNLNYQNVTDLIVGDPLIYLAANNVGDTDDIGIVGNYNDGTSVHTGIARDHTDGTWKFFSGVANEPTTSIDWANAQYPSVKTGNLFSANITGTGWANITGNVIAGNANLGNAVTANYFIGSGANLTSITGANVSGAVQYSTVANSVAVANVSGIGNIATVNLTGSSSNVLYGNGIFAPAPGGGGGGGSNISNGTSNVSIATANGNVTTSVGGTSNVLVVTTTGANIAGTLSSSGNVTAANLVGPHAGGNSNISITTNANITMYVAGNATARFTATTTGANIAGTLSASGNANVGNLGTAGLITVTGNANVGNLNTGGLITATGNVRGANLVTPGVLSVTGNANIGNIGTAGLITATGNIQGANLVTGGVLSVTGNANVGNLNTAGLITATGNLNAGNIVTTGLITATGNVTAGNLSVTGTVSANGITLGYLGAPFSGADVTTSYTLATPTDLGKIVSVGSGGSIVIPNAIFTSGDVVSVFNNTSANVDVTCSTTTAYIAGNNTSRSNVTLATRGLVTIVFISNSICVVSGSVS